MHWVEAQVQLLQAGHIGEMVRQNLSALNTYRVAAEI